VLGQEVDVAELKRAIETPNRADIPLAEAEPEAATTPEEEAENLK
jgi:hypothetical protein